ncbi:MAG: glycosyltransferase family 2 protein [Lachnospiraceae bacterium]|nr:glycosyltransferase family 2 protein [Lachnospiraceae bacterium]
MKTVSIVIPCYRSASYLGDVVKEILKKTKGINLKELILVDDGSPDDVWDVIRKLSRENKLIKGIHFSRNFGQHAALMAGYRKAGGDYIITMDDDGQSTPEGIELLVQEMEKGADVVYARYPQYKKTSFRKFGSFLNRKMSEWLVDKPKHIQGNSFFGMQGFIKDEIIRYDHSYPYIGGLIFRATQNISEVDIEHRNRKEGVSTYTISKLIRLWINGFTAFSIIPLRIASFMGMICAVLGFILSMYFIIRKLIHPEILLGFSSLISVILFIGGMIMIMLGMLGEYVGRLYINSNCSPQYVIKSTTDDEE